MGPFAITCKGPFLIHFIKNLISLKTKVFTNRIKYIIVITDAKCLQSKRRVQMNQKLMRKINNLENLKRFPAEELLQFVSLESEDKLLDLGAGVGYISLPFSKYVDEVIALDFDGNILKYLETKAAENGMTNIKTLVSDFKDIQLGNEEVDKAVASISLHEVQPLSLALGEIYRVLKDQGVFMCIELEKSALSKGPRVSSKEMKEEVLNAGFDNVEIFYTELKLVNEAVYIVVAQKNK